MANLLPIILAGLLLLGGINCSGKDLKKEISEILHTLPANDIDMWKKNFKLPLDERKGVAPKALLEFIRLDNYRYGINLIPSKRHQCADKHFNYVFELINSLPFWIKKALTDKFLGIYFVKNLGSNGYAKFLMEKRYLQGVVFVLNSDLCSSTLRDLLEFRENSPFQRGELLVKPIVEKQEDERSGVVFYLAHEIGHFVYRMMQTENDLIPQVILKRSGLSKFKSMSWSNDPEKDLQKIWKQKKAPAFYSKRSVPNDKLKRIFLQSQKANHGSLYSAINIEEDFSESFALSLLEYLKGQRISFSLITKNGKAAILNGCWSKASCPKRRYFIDDLFRFAENKKKSK